MIVCLLEHDKFDKNDIYKFTNLLLYVLKCIIKINFLLIEKIKNNSTLAYRSIPNANFIVA
jgi:hypothetical protein